MVKLNGFPMGFPMVSPWFYHDPRYRLAAEQGHAVSQWRMGELLESFGEEMRAVETSMDRPL